MLVSCPGCGAQLNLRSAASVFAVCPYCQSTVARTDIAVEAIGKMAIVDEDWSPIQIYTTGRYDNVNFVVVGRVKYRWERGTWNEWYLAFDSGESGWLCEAQGSYALSKPIALPPDLPLANGVRVGQSLEFETVDYRVDDIKYTTCESSEGELPFRAEHGRQGITIDLVGPKKLFGSIEYSGNEAAVCLGTYEEFDNLQLGNLRPLDGWN